MTEGIKQEAVIRQSRKFQEKKKEIMDKILSKSNLNLKPVKPESEMRSKSVLTSLKTKNTSMKVSPKAGILPQSTFAHQSTLEFSRKASTEIQSIMKSMRINEGTLENQ